MKKRELDEFNELLDRATIKSKLKKELRFVTSVAEISDEEWDERELLAISDRTGNKGVLLVSLDDDFYVLPYELKSSLVSSTGYTQSIICDFCRTWQSGSRAGSISFPLSRTSSISYLCCGDLKCSMHVRTKTSAAKVSRSQLREDLTIEQRVDRLKTRMKRFISKLPYEPIQ